MVVILVGVAVAIGMVMLCVGGTLMLARRRQQARMHAARTRERNERRRRAMHRHTVAEASFATFPAREAHRSHLHRGLTPLAVERLAPARIYSIDLHGGIHFVPVQEVPDRPDEGSHSTQTEAPPASSVGEEATDDADFEDHSIAEVLQVGRPSYSEPGDSYPSGREDDAIMDEGEELCCICLNDFKCGDIVRVLPCQQARNHVFCVECIDEWLSTKPECPICKRKFSARRAAGRERSSGTSEVRV